MFLRQLLRKPWAHRFPASASSRNLLHRPRFQSANTNPPPPCSSESAKKQARANKVLDRLPRFLQRYTDGLRNAPVSNVVSFLILHEITAVVPLVGLAGLFHYTNWLPPYISESQYISQGVEKFGSYFRKKGWFGFDKEDSKRARLVNISETGSKVVVEVATAYAITKALLPGRIIFSVWATPWFARVFIGRIWGGLRRLSGRGKIQANPAGRGVPDRGATATLGKSGDAGKLP